METYATRAHKFLRQLRKGSVHYATLIAGLREEVTKGNLSLEVVGTTEEELSEIEKKSRVLAAQEYLKLLRAGTCRPSMSIQLLFKELEKGKLTLHDVGTSEEEINSFREEYAH